LVLPTQARRAARKHAFEEALEEARSMPDDDLEDFIDAAYANPVSGPAVGSIGEMAVATGYVARASLAKAYEADEEDEAETIGRTEEEHASTPPDVPAEKPREAADKLMALLAERAHTPQELARLRRRFAAGNHPDRVSPELRPEALAAMAEVNAAIDRALKATRAAKPKR
jgi:hypothetical protein